MTDLHDLLSSATDEVRAPSLVAGALLEARRRRTRARGVSASVLAAAAVVTLVVAVRTTGGDPRTGPPADPVSTPGPAVHDRWDPRDVDELPAAHRAVAPLLPAVLDPPASVPRLAESPIEAAVLAVERHDDVILLASDGSWRSVSCENGTLSPDGTRLLVTEADGSAQVWDLARGTWTAVPRPAAARGWDFEGWHWAGETLLYDDLAGGWDVDPRTGAAEERPYPRSFWWTADAAGTVVESAEDGTPAGVTDWADGEPRLMSTGPTGRLQSLVADADTVVGTTYEGRGGFRLVVARRDDLRPVALQPLGDHEGNYSNWGLRPVALLDDTVLVRVAVPGRATVDGWRIVAWKPTTGEMTLVMRSDAVANQPVSFAISLL